MKHKSCTQEWQNTETCIHDMKIITTVCETTFLFSIPLLMYIDVGLYL